ncbi:MAG: hypothetical protein WCN98_07485 [Verrucomicrobiaceae bacterium]
MCLLVFSAGLTAIKASPEIRSRTGAANYAPATATAKTITYLTDKKWEPKLLLYGKNGIPALTFCEVEVN